MMIYRIYCVRTGIDANCRTIRVEEYGSYQVAKREEMAEFLDDPVETTVGGWSQDFAFKR